PRELVGRTVVVERGVRACRIHENCTHVEGGSKQSAWLKVRTMHCIDRSREFPEKSRAFCCNRAVCWTGLQQGSPLVPLRAPRFHLPLSRGSLMKRQLFREGDKDATEIHGR